MLRIVDSGERLGYLAMGIEITEQLGAPPLGSSVRLVSRIYFPLANFDAERTIQ